MSEPKKKNNLLSWLMRVGFSAALLGYIFSKIDITQTWTVFKSADFSYIFYAWWVFCFINAIILWRWFTLIRAVDLTTPFFTVARYFLVGLFGNLFLPSAVGGDIIKIVGLCKDSHQKPKVVASVLLDRLSGFSGIVVVAIGAFLFGYRIINNPSLLIFVMILAAVSLTVTFILFNERIYSFSCQIFNAFPRVKNSLMSLHYDVSLLKTKKIEGFKAIGFSCMAQILLAFVFYLVAKALHQDIPIIYFLIFVPMICVVSSVPSIGGLGVREAGAVYLFTKIGVPSNIALSISLINFSFMVLIGLLGGIVYVITLSSRRVQHYPSDTKAKPREA